MAKTIRPKDRDAILRALRSGVVPRAGLQHIQVGRFEEIRSFLTDIQNVADGGTSFRLVIGEYGSGKTFFLSLVRAMALEKGLVCMSADLSPARRLHGRDGQSRMLLSELVSSLSTRTRPDGNALPLILERFVAEARARAEATGASLKEAIGGMLGELREYPMGFAFARVVSSYSTAYEFADERGMAAALRWLRCEYSTRTDSFRETGVREIIDDRSFFNTLVLYSILVRQAGYKGLYVCLDEMVNLFKITNATSRKANYEEILSMLNSILQGTVRGLGIVMGGTPEFLTDTSRGLYSYEALRSRLAENSFGKALGLNDYNSTVLRLPALTPEEMYLLLQNVNRLYAAGRPDLHELPDEAIAAYLAHCANRIGESYFRTPRNTLKGFIDLLSVLEQYPGRAWQDMVNEVPVVPDRENTPLGDGSAQGGANSTADDEQFASFRL